MGFARYARELLSSGTINHVAKHPGVGWDMIKGIHKKDIKRRFDKPSLKSLTAITIDEFYAGPKAGTAYLESWMTKAEASEIEQMAKMAESLRRHQDGILAYFDHRITNDPMEATNAKIRVMQRQTYGLRDQEFFELRVCL